MAPAQSRASAGGTVPPAGAGVTAATAVGVWDPVVRLFHWLLVLGLVPASAQPCRRGIPCGEVGIQWLGFLNLPLMSLLAFSLIIALLASTRQKVSP